MKQNELTAEQIRFIRESAADNAALRSEVYAIWGPEEAERVLAEIYAKRGQGAKDGP